MTWKTPTAADELRARIDLLDKQIKRAYEDADKHRADAARLDDEGSAIQTLRWQYADLLEMVGNVEKRGADKSSDSTL